MSAVMPSHAERTLYLMRHGHASSLSPAGDRERPLTGRGRREAHEMGEVLARRGVHPDLVLVSSARRTRGTWRAVNDAGVDPETAVVTGRLYEVGGQQVIDLLRRVEPTARRVMVVGHFPGIPETIDLIVRGRGDQRALERMHFGYPTAGLATIGVHGEWADLPEVDAELLRFDFPVG